MKGIHLHYPAPEILLGKGATLSRFTVLVKSKSNIGTITDGVILIPFYPTSWPMPFMNPPSCTWCHVSSSRNASPHVRDSWPPRASRRNTVVLCQSPSSWWPLPSLPLKKALPMCPGKTERCPGPLRSSSIFVPAAPSSGLNRGRNAQELAATKKER